MRWEYKAVHSYGGQIDHREDEERYLSRMGDDGWELVAVAAHATADCMLYFKRPKS